VSVAVGSGAEADPVGGGAVVNVGLAVADVVGDGPSVVVAVGVLEGSTGGVPSVVVAVGVLEGSTGGVPEPGLAEGVGVGKSPGSAAIQYTSRSATS
jgi:hypothetical protein